MKKEIAFIFDLDGVIVDTAKYHFLAWRNLANSLGFEFTEEHNELLKGVSRVRSLEILLEIGKVDLTEEQKQPLLLKKNEEYLEYVNKMTADEILPGVNDLLNFFEEVTFISYFTVKPEENSDVIKYIEDFRDSIITKKSTNLWLLGQKLASVDVSSYSDQIKGFKSIKDLVKEL